ncbi:hypothetical protein KY289_013368 [Solanum tuberosum]|nr:hypothetical protein KY289_013368 [Solanum tuberosum]
MDYEAEPTMEGVRDALGMTPNVIDELITRIGGNAENKQDGDGDFEDDAALQGMLFEFHFTAYSHQGGASLNSPGGM